MKVRKLKGCPHEDILTNGCGNIPRPVVDTSPQFYIVDVEGSMLAWRRLECEELPDWKDVTADCRVVEPSMCAKGGELSPAGVWHGSKRLAILCCGGTHRITPIHLPNMLGPDMKLRSAFIIEEKVS